MTSLRPLRVMVPAWFLVALAAWPISAGVLPADLGRAAGSRLEAAAAADSWHLDIERAMDAIGLAPGMIVGEAGAGDGYFTIPMARRVGANGAVYANDISRRALRSLESRSERAGLANVTTVVGEVDDALFPRRDLQLVVIVHAFHDFSQPVEWLVNLKKYLRPGGVVAIVDRDPAKAGDSHFWPRQRVVRYAGEAGYDLVRAVDAETNHMVLLFRPR